MKVFRLVLLATMLSKATSYPAGESQRLFGSFLAASKSDCPPGFVHQENSCVCANWPEGMIVCDEDSQKASMRIGYCMTYINETGDQNCELEAVHKVISETIPTSSTIYFPVVQLISMILRVDHGIAKAYSAANARIVLLLHLLCPLNVLIAQGVVTDG